MSALTEPRPFAYRGSRSSRSSSVARSRLLSGSSDASSATARMSCCNDRTELVRSLTSPVGGPDPAPQLRDGQAVLELGAAAAPARRQPEAGIAVALVGAPRDAAGVVAVDRGARVPDGIAQLPALEELRVQLVGEDHRRPVLDGPAGDDDGAHADLHQRRAKLAATRFIPSS